MYYNEMCSWVLNIKILTTKFGDFVGTYIHDRLKLRTWILIIRDPGLAARVPVHQLRVREPQVRLSCPARRRIAAVDDIAAGPESKVAANGAGRRGAGIGGAQHGSTNGDGVRPLPAHGHNRPGGDVLQQAGEEWPLLNTENRIQLKLLQFFYFNKKNWNQVYSKVHGWI